MNQHCAVVAKFCGLLDQEFAILDRVELPYTPDELTRIGVGALQQLTTEELEILWMFARSDDSATHQILAAEISAALVSHD